MLGGGTAGTMLANKVRHRLPAGEWRVTIVDRDDWHLYQPGLLLLPFGVYSPDELLRHRRELLPDDVSLVLGEIERVDPEAGLVLLADGREVRYDYLVVASGASTRPDQTPGLLGSAWHRSAFDFHTLEGALALREKLRDWEGGRLVVHVTDMPVKCPVAPLEFAFLADAFFEEKGMRDKVELTYVTPLEGAFTKPVASAHLSGMLDSRNIAVEPDFVVDHVDGQQRLLVSADDRVVPFDLLVTVPLTMGADWVGRSGMGDDLNYVEVDKRTLRSTRWENVFALGDASNIPASKAGSVVHFSVDVVVENLLDQVAGRPLSRAFDGHANCFIESGHGKGLLIDFGFDTEPLPGRYPIPFLGPFSLLEETTVNHWGKLGFRWAYWHLLLKGRPLPVPARAAGPGARAQEGA